MNNDFEFDALIKKMAAEHQPELPSPGLIWWRAQIVRKQAEKERVERPVTIMRMIAVAVCLLVALGLCVRQGSAVWSALGNSALLSALPLLLGGAGLAGVLLALMWRTASKA